MDEKLSYRDAGVDLDAAQRHTRAIAGLIAGGQTGFAAVQPLPAGMREPMLVTCTDGVGPADPFDAVLGGQGGGDALTRP